MFDKVYNSTVTSLSPFNWVTRLSFSYRKILELQTSEYSHIVIKSILKSYIQTCANMQRSISEEALTWFLKDTRLSSFLF